MNEPGPIPQDLKDLIDAHLDGQLADDGVAELERRLAEDAEARRYYVRYARLHTDLHLQSHARLACLRAMEQIDQLPEPPTRHRMRSWHVLAAAALLLAAAGWWLWSGRHPGPDEADADRAIAVLVNAQNCTWAEGAGPEENLTAGKVLHLSRGLAEIRFRCGARVVLEGPARLELLSASSARLRSGKLTARVPEQAVGFEVLSPQGRVIDLGTEFGVAVSEGGATDVYVFEGKVEAGAGPDGGVRLTQHQAARIAAGAVTVRPAGPASSDFVRAIVAPPAIVPRTRRLTFAEAVPDTLRDARGAGTGLTHRLPGTGFKLPGDDPNLRLDPSRGRLELTTTNSDINTQFRLHHGEYLGVRLSELGFTGAEDFAVTATLPDIPALEMVGQFGLYAGARSDRNVRGGVLSSRRQEPGQYTQFMVNNDKGVDADVCRVGLLTTGADLRLTLKRVGGRYSLTVENLTAGSSSTLTIRHPAFLDGERDLYVGLFGANTQSEVRKTLVIKEFSVTVWTLSPAP